LADLWELVVDAKPSTTAMVTSERRVSYGQLDERANRLANFLLSAGVGSGDHVGLLLLNGTEYIEGMLAAFKIRAVPININYRYVENELRYLFDDSDLVALIEHRQFGPRAEAARSEKLRVVLVVEDGGGEPLPEGAVDYERALSEADPDRPMVGERSADDIYIAYTGGTTGMPKGVVWRQEDIFCAAMGGGDPFAMGNFISKAEELPERLPDVGMIALPTPPFMHVSAHWGAFQVFFGGGTVVIPPGGRFDPDAIWKLVEAEKINMLVIVGDAMARPLMNALEGGNYDASSVFVIGSGGAILSPTSKERLTKLFPTAIIADGFGSSETGVVGATAVGSDAATRGPPRFTMNADTKVLDDAGRPVEPGSGQVGRLAKRGHVPVGYYKDETKTAATFLEIEGQRWVLPGDMATVEEDGTVVLLGRGSVSINTGGEKVYPEEVEDVLKAHDGVADVVVVGVPDEQWGERVVAVVEPVPGAVVDLESVQALCREQLAGYKVPRELCVVPSIVRSPAGKADYRWAKATATRHSRI
jgi:acyl-CoA synthetase (AMP-forming)/AMP-acid ligase II